MPSDGRNKGRTHGRADQRIRNGTRVSGSHGELRANPNPQIKRRVKQRLYGVVIEATDAKKYRVRFDKAP